MIIIVRKRTNLLQYGNQWKPLSMELDYYIEIKFNYIKGVIVQKDLWFIIFLILKQRYSICLDNNK